MKIKVQRQWGAIYSWNQWIVTITECEYLPEAIPQYQYARNHDEAMATAWATLTAIRYAIHREHREAELIEHNLLPFEVKRGPFTYRLD